MEKLLLGNWLVHKYSWQASTHLHRICHCKLLPFHIWRTTPNTINFAKKHTKITNQDRKEILLYNGSPWVKKDNDGMFDITMESFDGAEVCKLVGLIILNALAHKYGTNNIWLYRDDELIIFKNTTGLWAERTRKEITRHFKEHGLKITTQSNLKSVDYHTQLEEWTSPTIQKTKQWAALHQHKI